MIVSGKICCMFMINVESQSIGLMIQGAYLAMLVCIGSGAIGTWKGAEQIIEGAILFDHDHNMFDRIGCVRCRSYRGGRCYWTNANKREQDCKKTSEMSLF